MPEKPKRPLKVFLCHSPVDKTAMLKLYARLIKDGIDAWLAQEKILPGQDREFEIHEAVRQADVVVVCLSKQFNQSGAGQKEVRLALDVAIGIPEGEIFIIPARLEECDNLESLRKWQWVDLFAEDGYERLLSALRARAEEIDLLFDEEERLLSTTTIKQERVLEAAIEKEVSVNVPTSLLVWIKRLESKSIVSIVSTVDEDEVLDEDNVKSKELEIEFRIENGRVQPVDVSLRLVAYDFTPSVQQKKITVPPEGDSEVCTFIVTPEKAGKLLLNLEVLRNQVSIATRTLRTTVMDSVTIEASSMNLISIPIIVLVQHNSNYNIIESSIQNVVDNSISTGNIQVGGSIEGNLVIGNTTQNIETVQIDQLIISRLPSDFPSFGEEIPYLDDFAPLPKPYKPAFLGDSFPENKPAFVERSTQLKLLEEHLERILEGRGGVAFLAGDVGLGKTALLDVFTRRAIEKYPQLLAANGTLSTYTGITDPYLPFLDIFSMLTGDLETRWSTGLISRQHALRVWESLPANLDAILEYGIDLIGVLVFPNRIPVHSSAMLPGGVDRYEQLAKKNRQKLQFRYEVQQVQIFEECVNTLKAIAERQPVLLVLDDLHWADTGSLSLLQYLGKRISNDRILIIGAYQPAERGLSQFNDQLSLEDLVDEFRRENENILVDLDAITIQENRNFVEAYLDLESNSLGLSFREELFQHTGGHPLFTIELLRNMKESGILFQDQNNCWTIRQDFDLRTLPPRIDDVIDERLEDLSSELRELLEVGSVEGVTFTSEVLATVLDKDEYTVLRQLSQDLSKHYRLIREAGGLEVSGPKLARFRFSHNLFQKYLYSSLNIHQRGLLHERVAGAIERLYAGQVEDFAASLANHYTQIGNPEKTIHYLLLAGERAYQHHAYQEVIETNKQALGMLQNIGLPPTSMQRRQQAYCHIHIGQAYRGMGQLIECRDNLQAALTILDRPIPVSSAKLFVALAEQFGLQVLHRLLPALYLDKIGKTAERDHLTKIVKMYSLMAELYFVAIDKWSTVYCIIRALNLAEQIGPSPALAEAYAQMSMGAGLERMHRIAIMYQKLADEVIKKIDYGPSKLKMGEAGFIRHLECLGCRQTILPTLYRLSRRT